MQVRYSVTRKLAWKNIVILSSDFGLQIDKSKTISCDLHSKWNISEGFSCESKYCPSYFLIYDHL